MSDFTPPPATAPVFAPASPAQVYVVQAQRGPSNGLAVAAMVLGIVAIAIGIWSPVPILGIFNAVVGGLVAIVGAILGHLGLKAAVTADGVGRGQAMTGLVLSYVTIGIVLLVTAFWVLPMILGSLGLVGATVVGS